MKKNILTPKTPEEKIVFDNFHWVKCFEELDGKLPSRKTGMGRWVSNMRDIKKGYRTGKFPEILKHLCNRFRKHYFDSGTTDNPIDHKKQSKKAQTNARIRGVNRQPMKNCVTSIHKVLTDCGWAKACDVKKNDKIGNFQSRTYKVPPAPPAPPLNSPISLIDYSKLAKDLKNEKRTLNFEEIRKMLSGLSELSSHLAFLQDSVTKTKEAFEIFLKTFNQLTPDEETAESGAIDYKQLAENLKKE